MDQDKKKYYINMGSQEISQIKFNNNEEFIIYATDDEVRMLRGKMENMHDADFRAFFRSHVPIMSYHNDESNDDYDIGITEAYQMIYDLGDEHTKSHIDKMGVLSDKHL
ncbi:hydrolase [Virgibacillus ndiopensis]|uniref:hydrolase n=1 Tax=Virgibacillus ndiopensis TaxID=2004408 RepID=UPI000C0864AB|nr:hydrolase [Virgibacillus ndiopensis]